MRALVIDGGHAPSALAATRELGRAGWTVGVGAAFPDSYAAASRWCDQYFKVPSPAAGLDGFVSAINRAVDVGRHEVVFVSGDAEAMAISFARDEIRTRVPYSEYPYLKRSFDKLELSRVAEQAGVPVPRTVEAYNGALESFDGPVVVKSRFHWEPNGSESEGRLEARIAGGPTEADAYVEDIRRAAGEPILQEVIEGQLMGFTVLTDTEADTVAELQQMAPLTWRPKVGMPARAYTVPVDEELARGIRRMLKELGWFGLVQLQFIVSSEGCPYLIDFNGRAYASQGLALAAGINFHDLWARIATERDWAFPGPARTGLRYQWTEGDIRRCLAGNCRNRTLALAGCLGYGFGATHPIWTFSDPGPFMRYPGDLLRRYRRRRPAPPVPEPAVG
jgi:predicted ATP-grasp superfamily ATP-dependent carboligase